MRSWPLQVLITILLSVIFTLYLAPTRFETADLLAAVLLVLTLVTMRMSLSELTRAIRPMAPLLAILAYAITQSIILGDGWSGPYIRQLLYGFVPYILFYFLFREYSVIAERAPLLIMGIFVLPGLVHITYMYFDIIKNIKSGVVAHMTASHMGVLEYVKETPRVGRRYLSVAIFHFLWGGLLIAWYFRFTPFKNCGWFIVGLCILSLALLDARAAYASVIIGGLLMVFVTGLVPARQALRSFLSIGSGWKLVLTGILIAAVTVGFSAGKSRWVALAYSIQTATNDVLNANEKLVQRPYVNAEYWIAPIEDVCTSPEHFRCKVDQSAYLRFAWLLEGLTSVIDNPLGIGHSIDYLARLWGVAGDKSKYHRSDSLLVEHIISFGLPGIALFGWLLWGIIHSFRRLDLSTEAIFTLYWVCALIFICIGRSLVDAFSDGLWRYLMSLLGMYYGLLNAYGRPSR